MNILGVDSKTAAANFENGGLLKNRYRSIGKLNEGSYGIVYLAEDIFTRQKYAIKYIYPYSDDLSISTNEEAEKEINIYLKLGNHKNIASLVDYFDSFLVLEYCEKGDLYDLIKAGEGPKTKKEIIDLIGQLIDLVSYAHARGVYHRDIKPENIFVTNDCQIKLGDWGLASTERFCTDYDVGSDRYMAPELFDSIRDESDELEELNDGRYDASKVDIWALGICILNIIFHKNPFSIANANDKMFMNFCVNREILFDIFPTMSTDLFNALRHCLTINPDNRDLTSMKQELLKVEDLTYDYDLEEGIEEEREPSQSDKGTGSCSASTYSVSTLDTIASQEEKSSYSTRHARPINIDKSFEIHQDRKPLSIQTPHKLFVGSMASYQKNYNRQELYTPPAKRFLDPNKFNNFKNGLNIRFKSGNHNRGSRSSFTKHSYSPRKSKATDVSRKAPDSLHRNSAHKGKDSSVTSKNGFSSKRKVGHLENLDTTKNSNIYIPPNLRNRLKSPAFQAKTITTDVYQMKKPFISIDDLFESQLPEDVVFDDLDDVGEDGNMVNNLKGLKVNDSTVSSTSVSTTTTPRHSDEFTSAIPSLVSQSSASKLSSFSEKSSVINNNTNCGGDVTKRAYVPPHHRPDYDASKYRRRRSSNDHNSKASKPLAKPLRQNNSSHLRTGNSPNNNIVSESLFERTLTSFRNDSSNATLSASMPQPLNNTFDHFNWADDLDFDEYSDNIGSDTKADYGNQNKENSFHQKDELGFFSNYLVDSGTKLLLNSYTSNLKRIASAINVQM